MAIYVRSLLSVYVSDSQRMTQLLKCHIRQRRGNYMHQVAGMCVCVGGKIR